MGGLLAFRVGNYDNTAEREQFRFLCEQLRAHYENSNEFCVIAGNYNIGCELDALFIKKDAIIAIEFKNYGGKVVANENGEWTCDGDVIKGGSRKTVLQQARINHSTVKRELKVLGVAKENIKDVPTLVIFNQPIEIINNLSATNKSWLHITDNEHFVEKLDDITCPHTDLNPLGIVNLAEALNLNSFYLTEFSNATYGKPSKPTERIELFEDIKKYETPTEKGELVEEPTEQNLLDLESCVIEDEESISLSKFVQRIVKLALKLENFTVKILDGARVNSFPAVIGFKPSHKFVVIINADGIGEHCTKLSKFTSHDVRAISPTSIFWEEGDVLDAEMEKNDNILEVSHEEIFSNTTAFVSSNITFRKSKTILPHWLDKSIFCEHNAIYAPEHERYEYNLDLNDEELNVYLGTYFPRSYAEMFCIIDNLMQNKTFSEIIQVEDVINVLDCGCGTGGEILGLITALAKHLSQVHVNVTAIDGSERALAILKELVESNPNRNVHTQLTTLCQTFNTSEDLVKFANGKKNYHFVLCDKMVCELISKQILPNDAYAIMAKALVPHLHEKGLLIMLDVTTKDPHAGLFYPQLMNNAINEFVRKSRTVETLLPLSCACNGECKDLCFMQQTFCVSHSHKTTDESRVCYRVLCRKKLKEAILKDANTEGFAHVIHPVKYNQNDEAAICRLTKDNQIKIDSFNINLQI